MGRWDERWLVSGTARRGLRARVLGTGLDRGVKGAQVSSAAYAAYVTCSAYCDCRAQIQYWVPSAGDRAGLHASGSDEPHGNGRLGVSKPHVLTSPLQGLAPDAQCRLLGGRGAKSQPACCGTGRVRVSTSPRWQRHNSAGRGKKEGARRGNPAGKGRPDHARPRNTHHTPPPPALRHSSLVHILPPWPPSLRLFLPLPSPIKRQSQTIANCFRTHTRSPPPSPNLLGSPRRLLSFA